MKTRAPWIAVAVLAIAWASGFRAAPESGPLHIDLSQPGNALVITLDGKTVGGLRVDERGRLGIYGPNETSTAITLDALDRVQIDPRPVDAPPVRLSIADDAWLSGMLRVGRADAFGDAPFDPNGAIQLGRNLPLAQPMALLRFFAQGRESFRIGATAAGHGFWSDGPHDVPLVTFPPSRSAEPGALNNPEDVSTQSASVAVTMGALACSPQGKAGLVKDPALKAVLENAHVKVFSDLPQPKRGTFANLVTEGILVWEPIPRTAASRAVSRGVRFAIPSTSQTIGKPGVGTAANLALGVAASLAKAGVADSIYRDAASVLKNLLQQIAQNGDADEQDWTAIEDKLKEIANMKQSILGYIGEFMSYGQGSLKEQQAMAMMSLALDLGQKFGYQNKRTWGDVFQGRFGRFEKER